MKGFWTEPFPLRVSSVKKKWTLSIKGFFSKCDQFRRNLRIWSHLHKKSLKENLIFVQCSIGLRLTRRLFHVKILSKGSSIVCPWPSSSQYVFKWCILPYWIYWYVQFADKATFFARNKDLNSLIYDWNMIYY